MNHAAWYYVVNGMYSILNTPQLIEKRTTQFKFGYLSCREKKRELAVCRPICIASHKPYKTEKKEFAHKPETENCRMNWRVMFGIGDVEKSSFPYGDFVII